MVRTRTRTERFRRNAGDAGYLLWPLIIVVGAIWALLHNRYAQRILLAVATLLFLAWALGWSATANERRYRPLDCTIVTGHAAPLVVRACDAFGLRVGDLILDRYPSAPGYSWACDWKPERSRRLDCDVVVARANGTNRAPLLFTVTWSKLGVRCAYRATVADLTGRAPFDYGRRCLHWTRKDI